VPEVVGIRFRSAGKIYYFDPRDFVLEPEQRVIVETTRGMEHGEVAIGNKVVEEEEIVSPLKPVLRLAIHLDMNRETKEPAKPITAQKISRACRFIPP